MYSVPKAGGHSKQMLGDNLDNGSGNYTEQGGSGGVDWWWWWWW